MFTCAAMLIVPFVLVYTQGIVDVDYNQPLLGYIMCLAYWINIIRLPYQNVMETAGHFMQTKKMAIIEAVLNVGISCILVMMFGIVGVAVGTVIAMGYRTVCYAAYASQNILNISIGNFIKRILVSGLALVIVFVCCFSLNLSQYPVEHFSDFWEWSLFAMGVFLVVSVVTIGVNFVLYPDNPLTRVLKTKRK